MIIDADFLSVDEINGIRGTVFSQEVPVFWTFHSDQMIINHYAKSKMGEESKFNKLTDNILKKFCNKNNIRQTFVVFSRIFLIPQHSMNSVPVTSKLNTLLYVIDSSDSKIIINDQEFDSIAGTAFVINANDSYLITPPKFNDFAALVEVSFIS